MIFVKFRNDSWVKNSNNYNRQYPKNGLDRARKENIVELVFDKNDLEAAMKLIQPRDRLEKVILIIHFRSLFKR